MRHLRVSVVALVLAVAPAGIAKPLVAVQKYDGKFKWIKLGAVPSESLKTLANAGAIIINISFPHDVKLTKDARGYAWFTFIVADQGSDWKWNQTKGSGGVPIVENTIKAGKYAVSVSLAGIPKTVLKDKKQTISLGPGASGLVTPTAFTIDGLRGK